MYNSKVNAFANTKSHSEKRFGAKSKTLLLSTTAVMAGAMLLPANAVADNSWDYDTVLGGNVSKDISVDDITDITVDGGNGFVEGNADIAAGHTVNVDGINGAKTFAYRDNRDNIESTLAGDLNSNIQIVIIDKDGLFFTDSANIDVQGLIATSADIAVADIMDGGTLVFDNVGDGGAVFINGSITVAEAGLAAFVSPFITNHGVINAKLGNVVMAAGETVTLDLYGDGLLELSVDGELEDALIENHNEILARGGYVQMSASAAKGTVDNVINNSGLITVASATVDGGKIILSGNEKGTVKNSGEVVTSTGGEIAISGERFVQDSEPLVEGLQVDAIVPVPATKPRLAGAGGDITIATSGNVGILDGRVEAKGGDIVIKNGGIFKSINPNTLRTEGEGTITLSQNAGSEETMSIGSIQNAIDAIHNTGTGQNTIHVGAGTYNESLVVDHDNLTLNGANAGVSGTGERGDESVIQPNSPGVLVVADNTIVDGFAFVGAGSDAGVEVDGADNVTVSNNTMTGFEYGVQADTANDLDVTGNFVDGADIHGIHVTDSNNIVVDGNTVNDAVFDGIRVEDGKSADILGNIVNNSGDDGIDVDRNNDVIITGNTVSGTQLNLASTDGNAIEVFNSQRARINDNVLSNTGADGIDVKSSRDVKVHGNMTTDTGDDGIDVDNAERIEAYENTILNAGGEGFEITNSEDSHFHDNTITNAADDGIDVKTSDNIVIERNTIDVTGSDGVQVVDTENALVDDNGITNTGENGVFIENALDATISNNFIFTTGTNGIYVSGSNNADVIGNDINFAGEHGIKVNPSDDVEIIGNFIFGSFFDGIRVNDGKRAIIDGNFVDLSGDDGIDVDNNDDVIVKNNIIDTTQLHPDATDGNAIEVSRSDRADISFNTTSYTGADGVDVKRSDDVKVYENTIIFAGDDGIDVDKVGDIEIYDNYVDFAGGEGMEVTEADNANIHDNTLLNITDDGIDVKLSDDIIIQTNTIDVVGSDGVQIVDSERALVDDNGITNTVENGVYTLNSPDATISNNVIDTTGTNGVYVSSGSGTTIIGNTISNSGENNIKVNPSDFINIHKNVLSFAGEDGINVRGGTGHDIRGNYIFHALNDGIDVRDFGHAWIAYNEIEFTGDDGIDVREGNFVSIYDNYVDLSGYLPNTTVAFGPFSPNIEVGEDANGIYVSNVGGGDLPPSTTEDVGFGSSFYGTSVEIYNNEVSNSEDDGIQIDNYDEKSRLTTATIEGGDSGDYSAYIGHNIVGHVGDDGIDVDGNDVTYVKGNAVTLAEDKGITIDGGRYAGVFDNRVLLTGNDGIQVENVYGGLDAMLLGDIDYGYGWSVNVSGNEVALTGDDGIEVRYSGPTKVANNKVFITGLGEDLGDVIGTVNDFANGTFAFSPPFLAPQIQDIEDDFEGFGWEWGNGHGINVHGISGAQFSPNGWAADIRGNTVKYTGGHGILVENNDRTRINRNRVRYAGIDYTFFHGTDGMLEMLDSGAFASDKRRDLWMSSDESLVSVMEGYFGTVEEQPDEGSEEEYINILDVGFDSHDGIHAENIRSNVFVTGALRDSEGQKEIVEGGYEHDYDLKIVGNRINTTGDDGIEVDGAGRTLIGWNRIRNAGYGDDVPYSGDRTGADGIHVRNVFNNILTTPTFAGIDGSGFYGYAVNIIGNKINTTGDDGIAVVNSSSAYIANNRIRNAGYHGSLESEVSSFEDDRRRRTRFGSDGIHVRNVYGEEFSSVGFLGVGYAVVIQGNKINTTGDDGIEVRNAGRTFIDNNRIRNAGFGGGKDYDRGDRFGADGIFVTNVHANEFYQEGPVDFAGGSSNPENLGYSVIITNNKVNYTGDDGIEVQNSGSTLIDNNRVRNAGDDGITVTGSGFFGPDTNLLQGDALSAFKGSGASVVITNNKVKNSGGDGIHTTDIDDLVISDNKVRDSYEHGVYVSGGYNGYVEFQGNMLKDNGQFSGSAQARFESGDIDMSDLERPNMFINTTGVPATALQFDDVFGILPDSEDDIEAAEFLGGTGLRIVGETLGSTVFDGYLPEGSFYVRFEDGSILDPDTNLPILIDAENVSFDGVIPGEFVGEFLSSDERQFIEDRLFDADDETVDGRGQIFEDLPEEEASIDNIQDFFDNFNNQNGVSNQASLVINGLPSIGGGTGSLNDIAPAAGGDGSEFANINPAAGESDESQEVTCMADAVNSLETGAVTYNFGGTFEDGIASEAGCVSRNI